MKLLKATIDGFGKWTDTTFDFSENMLYCFYGENESGKSTLQQFILYMLFGLPPKKRKRFVPKMRSSIGGTLTVYDHEIGSITVQRVDGDIKCYLENGEERNETWWKEQLQHISKEIYTAVNAFSATDLEAIQTMDHDAVSDILFSIGLSGSTAIYEVEKQLADQLDSLYKRRGKNPKMNGQINQVVKTSVELNRVRQNEASYLPVNREKEEEEYRIKMHQEKLQALKKESMTIDKTIQALPQIRTLQQNQERLTAYPEKLSFPREGMERYQKLKTQMLPIISEHDLLKEKQQEYERESELVRKDLLTEEEIGRAEQLLQEKLDYQHRQKSINEKKAALYHEQENYNQLIFELGWMQDESEDTVLPFHLEATWQQLADDERTLYTEKLSLEEEQHLLEEKRHSLLQDEKDIRNKLLPDTERKQMETRLASEQLDQNNNQQKKEYETWKNRQKDRMKKMVYLYAAAAGILVLSGLILDKPLLYALVLLIVVGGAVQYFYNGSQTKTVEMMLFTGASGKALSPEEKLSFEKKLREEEERKHQLSSINYELRQNNLLQIQAEEQQQILDKRAVQLDDRKESEQFTYPFLKEVEVSHWPELLKLIRELQKKHQTVTNIEKEILNETAIIEAIDQQIEAFPYAGTFAELEQLLEIQKEKKASLKQYERELEGTKNSLLEKEKHLEALKKEQNALFHIANVEGEEAFYQAASDISDKHSLLAETAAIKEQLDQLFSETKTEKLLADDLDQLALESEKERLETAIHEHEEAVSHAYHRLGELQAKVQQLEASEDSSQLSLTYEMDKNLLNEQAKEWAVFKLVQTALQKAKQAYQEKHFANVMTLTGTYFKQLTEGRYQKVHPPEGNGLFQVEASKNMRYTVEELSQGTIDQLYVSLRFAIAKAMRDQFDLPLLIDDAFVHFDKNRTERTIRLMEQLSREQQVIFFTCKEEVAAHFKHVFSIQQANKISS